MRCSLSEMTFFGQASAHKPQPLHTFSSIVMDAIFVALPFKVKEILLYIPAQRAEFFRAGGSDLFSAAHRAAEAAEETNIIYLWDERGGTVPNGLCYAPREEPAV